jgi:hypothetical protein
MIYIQLVSCNINFIHINIFNLLIKIYLFLIFIKYLINESRVKIKNSWNKDILQRKL